jgi:hypothetical protein
MVQPVYKFKESYGDPRDKIKHMGKKSRRPVARY